MSKGICIVVSGPSASGKSTVTDKLISEIPNAARMVTMTTRTARPGELHGRDYFFINREQFEAKRDSGEMIEWAETYGNLYGSSKVMLNDLRASHDVVLAVLDVRGAAAYRKAVPDAVLVFLAPTSLDELRGRFERRPGSTPETTATRLQEAEREMAQSKNFDHVIINADGQMDETVSSLRRIVAEALMKRQ